VADRSTTIDPDELRDRERTRDDAVAHNLGGLPGTGRDQRTVTPRTATNDNGEANSSLRDLCGTGPAVRTVSVRRGVVPGGFAPIAQSLTLIDEKPPPPAGPVFDRETQTRTGDSTTSSRGV